MIEDWLAHLAHDHPYQGGTLDGAALAGARLTDGTVLTTSLRGADFTNAHLTRMTFCDCDLTGCRFDGASIGNTTFVRCTMPDSTWREAICTGRPSRVAP